MPQLIHRVSPLSTERNLSSADSASCSDGRSESAASDGTLRRPASKTRARAPRKRRHTRCYQLAFRRALALDAELERERAEAELVRKGR